MTLFRQLLVLIISVVVVLSAGSFLLSSYNTKVLVEEQMRVHAQDTATSLAISITQAVTENDQARLDTLFNAVSDLGYYKEVYFLDLENTRVIERVFPVDIQGVPEFFVGLVNLPKIEGRAEVSSGWLRLGDVVVVSHPGQAYRQMWQVITGQFLWYFAVLVMVSAAGTAVIGWFLRPLREVESQADAICEQRFDIQEELPKSRELKRVVQAMNRMATRLRDIFENQVGLITQLQARTYRDPVTGLSNREHFDAQLRAFIASDEDKSGALMLISVADFEQINKLVGRVEGNNLLYRIGRDLMNCISIHAGVFVSRRQGPQFALFLPHIERDQVAPLAQSAFDALENVDWEHKLNHPLVINMGCVYQEEVTSRGEILGIADLALNHISAKGRSGWIQAEDIANNSDVPILMHSVEQWREILEKALEALDIKLVVQPVIDLLGNKVVGHELYSRIVDDERTLSAKVSVPMLERFGMAEAFDKTVLQLFRDSGTWEHMEGFIGVNLCIQSLKSSDFMYWLRDFLQVEKKLAAKLIIEIPEHALHTCEDAVRELDGVLLSRGARLGVDHFGLGTSSFSYLGNLPLAYLKVHQSFIHQIDQSPESQFYVKSLAQVAHSRDMSLYVEGVESESEWTALKALGIDGGQGYFLGEPAEMPQKH